MCKKNKIVKLYHNGLWYNIVIKIPITSTIRGANDTQPFWLLVSLNPGGYIQLTDAHTNPSPSSTCGYILYDTAMSLLYFLTAIPWDSS